MKKTLFAIAMTLATFISYGQSKDIYVSDDYNKMVSVSEYGVMLTFQNEKYDYVQDIEAVILGSVPKTIEILKAALKGLTDPDNNLVDYGEFYITDFGYKDMVIINRNEGNEYTILSPSEIKLIINRLQS